MATYNASISVNETQANLIRCYMDKEPTDESKAFINDAIIFTARFENGYEMDVKCCGVSYFEDDGANTAWGEAVLFNERGQEIQCSEVAEGSSEFFCEWMLWDRDGNNYVVDVMEKED